MTLVTDGLCTCINYGFSHNDRWEGHVQDGTVLSFFSGLTIEH